MGRRSKDALHKLVGKLERLGAGKRDETGRLIPGSIGSPARILGTVEAGLPSTAEEELCDTLSLDGLLIKNPEATFLFRGLQ